MSIEVRLVTDEEHGRWFDQLGRAFFQRHPEGTAEYYLTTYDDGRTRGAFDGTAVIGTLRSFATDLTVPGPSTVPASALTAVSVATSHRRRGVLTSMIVPDLRDSKARGEVVSILLASEYPIYGRFGYGPATEQVVYELASQELRFITPTEGAVQLVETSELRSLAPPVYDRFRATQPGSIIRHDEWWDRVTRQIVVPDVEPWKGFQAVYRAPDGEVEGYASYEGKFDWTANPWRGSLTIHELVSLTPRAYRSLWEFCCSVDLQQSARAPGRAVDEVLPFLVDDARKVRVTARGDFLWVRILDTEAALAGRRYGCEGRLVLEVTDGLALASGRFALESSAGGASCEATTAEPDLSIEVRALGAAYLGGVSFVRLAEAGLASSHRDDALVRADRLFLTSRAPWSTTGF